LTFADVSTPAEKTIYGFTLERFQSFMVWLMFVSTFVVLIEPAPSDLLFVIVMFCSFWSGVKYSPLVAPLVFFLMLYNLGAFTSYMQDPADTRALNYVITTFYMALSAVFLSAYVREDTIKRVELLRNALIIGAVIATIFAIAGYLNLFGFVGGAVDYIVVGSKYNRAVGLFKDPNVYSTYLLLPAVFLVQGFMLGKQRYPIISALSLIFILGGLFLAFSRGAWIDFILAVVMVVGLTFVMSPTQALKSRIILFIVVGLLLCAVMMAGLLSVEKIRFLFLDRFTLVKSYDAGETGRFGNQLNSIPMLLQRPLGFGPLRFTDHFPIAPHNTYINAFSSYGWLGGVSYFCMIGITLVIAVKTIFYRTPWQHFSFAVFGCLIAIIFQGIQIDTDHWRHFYWLIGLMWGLFVASVEYANGAQQNMPEQH
jgi:hypothetical protein